MIVEKKPETSNSMATAKVKTDLEFQVMTYLLTAEPHQRYGWAMRNWLEERRGLSVRPQSIYRVLDRLEQRRDLLHPLQLEEGKQAPGRGRDDPPDQAF